MTAEKPKQRRKRNYKRRDSKKRKTYAIARPTSDMWLKKVRDIASLEGVPAPEILSGVRGSRVISFARWRAFAALIAEGYSQNQIAEVSGFDHTAVRYGLKRLSGCKPAALRSAPKVAAA